jgi:class 3 adenylate cyclase
LEDLVLNVWQHSPDSMQRNLVLLQGRLDAYRELNDDVSTMRLEFILGTVYKNLNDAPKSIQHFFTALTLADKLALPERVAVVNLEIGLIYYMQASWERAVEFFRRSLAYYEGVGDTKRATVRTYLIALSLNNLDRYAEALPLFRSIYAKYAREGKWARQVEAGTGYANALRGAGHLDSAELLYRKLLDIATQAGDDRSAFFATTHAGLAHVYVDMGRTKDAEREALTSLSFSRPNDYFLPRLEAQRILYEVYRKHGDHERALHYLEEYTRDHDSLQDKENLASMSVAQALYEYHRKEEALILEEGRKRQVVIIVAALTSVLVIVTLLFYRSLSKQKRRTETLLENILPKETIAELKRDGVVTPRTHDNVTIMFCDVKDFTVIAERLPPDVLVSMLDLYFRRFDEIIAEHGLEKIKTIGDAYMAAGGLHDRSRNYAEECVLAAQKMLHFIADVSANLISTHGYAFEFRIGLHTGSVVSGVVGQDKYAYDIWGDAVNTASRIEQASEVGMINLSGSTYELIKDRFTCVHRGGISVKNKGEVEMYFLVSENRTP